VYRQAAERIVSSRFLVALTGAGVSADSGIPTFRGPGGLWNQHRPEELATPYAFVHNPRLVWEWYRWRMQRIAAAEPNPAHKALANLEQMGLLKALITQNVDGLHQRAGSQHVVELHGNIWRARCIKCAQRIELDGPPDEIPPRCSECEGLLRPDVVWFGEPLPREEWERAVEAVVRCDVLLVVGTSGVVAPANLLPVLAKEHGAFLIEVNIQETAITPYADVLLKGRASEVFRKLMQLVVAELESQREEQLA